MYLSWDASLVPMDQPRYSLVSNWKYYQILGKHNDMILMDLIDKGTDEEEYDSAQNVY